MVFLDYPIHSLVKPVPSIDEEVLAEKLKAAKAEENGKVLKQWLSHETGSLEDVEYNSSNRSRKHSR